MNCYPVTFSWDKYVHSEIKTLASGAEALGAAYSDVTKAVDVGRAVLTRSMSWRLSGSIYRPSF